MNHLKSVFVLIAVEELITRVTCDKRKVLPSSYSLHGDYVDVAWHVAKKLLQYSNDLVHSATRI